MRDYTTRVVFRQLLFCNVALAQKKRGPERTRPSFSKEAARIGARIEKLRGDKGWNGTYLAGAVGISQQALSKIEAGQINPDNPKARWTLSRLAEKLGDNLGLGWIDEIKSGLGEGESPVFFGEKERELVQQLAKDEGRLFPEQARELILEALMHRGLVTDRVEQSDVIFLADYLPKPTRMKLLGEIAAGEPIHVFERSESIEVPGYKLKPGKQYFVLRVRGNSMTDEGIFDGSFIICESTQTAKKGDRIVALIDDEKATVKKYYPDSKTGRIRLQPANELHKPIYVKPERLKIQGIVIGTWRP